MNLKSYYNGKLHTVTLPMPDCGIQRVTLTTLLVHCGSLEQRLILLLNKKSG